MPSEFNSFTLGDVSTIISVVAAAFVVVGRMAKLELKVDTMWDAFKKRLGGMED